jgi:hypothetical protein
MTSASDLKYYHISILYYWNKRVRSARVIHRKTNTHLRTIYCDINKLKQTNSLKHREAEMVDPRGKNGLQDFETSNFRKTYKDFKKTSRDF